MEAKKTGKKRWWSFLLLLSVIINSLPNGFVRAQEAAEPTVFEGAGFTAAFRITSRWETGAGAEITLTNTGEGVWEDWALSFLLPGTAEQVWNAKILSREGDRYTIGNAEWNREVKSGESVRFGFTITAGGELVPPEEYILTSRKEETPEDRYEVTYQVTGDWGSGFEGKITIENKTGRKIENWELSFDLEEELTNVWDARIISHTENHYVIRNAGYNAELEPGQTITLGFSGKNNRGGEPVQVILRESRRDLPADENRDTDEDGIPDALETELGTNPVLFDTDGDGLDDGYEYYRLGTDPAREDTDGNGCLDGEEDFDGDGLTNEEEYRMQTGPYSPDTDLDGLSDREERDYYLTDPLNEDTDGDGILDGDEAALGLDPLSPNTHGVPDYEYTFEQTVSESVLEDIGENNAYELSLELTAAGLADHSLIVEESVHTELLSDNDAILGKVIDLDYEGLRVEKAVLTFQINESLVENPAPNYQDPGLEGIKRFQIFRYEEEGGILYPMETTFDEEKQTCKAQTDRLGTYCLVDLDQWLYDLGMPEEEEAGEPILAAAVAAAGNAETEAEAPDDLLPEDYEETRLREIQERFGGWEAPVMLTEAAEYHKKIELVFVIDTSGTMNGKIKECKDKMKTLVRNLYAAGVSANVAVLTFDDYNHDIVRYTLEDGKKKWGKNPEEAAALISQVQITDGADENHLDALEEAAGLKYKGNTAKFAVMLTDEPAYSSCNHTKLGTSGVAKKLKEAGVITSVVCLNGNAESFRPIFQETGGIQISITSDFNYVLESFIETVMRKNTSYTVVLSNTLSTAVLKKSPSRMDLKTDSDGDTLPDSKEINWTFIREDKDTILLPTLYEYANSLAIKMEGFQRLLKEKKDYIYSIRVLPIFSNPASRDSDKDGYEDNKDKRPLVKSVREYTLKKRNYIEVYYLNEDKKGHSKSYGGNQSWFKKEWCGNGSKQDNTIREGGCGLIAAADLFLYWAYQKPDVGDALTGPCLKEKTLTQATYMDYVRKVTGYYTHTPSAGEFGPSLARDINYYAALHDLKYQSEYKNNVSADKAEKLIVKMLKNNIPVIVQLAKEREGGTDKEIAVYSYYQRDKGEEGYDVNENALHQYQRSRDNVNEHYFAVTGILYDENTENENERIMLRISTWGGERYINFQEYKKYLSGVSKLLSGIIYIEEYE